MGALLRIMAYRRLHLYSYRRLLLLSYIVNISSANGYIINTITRLAWLSPRMGTQYLVGDGGICEFVGSYTALQRSINSI